MAGRDTGAGEPLANEGTEPARARSAASAWPAVVMTKTYGDGSTLHVEVEIDDAVVLHTLRTVRSPDSDTIQVSGCQLRLLGSAEAEDWTYLDLPEARELYRLVGEAIAILEEPDA